MSANAPVAERDQRLKAADRLAVVMRSFLIQSVWNTRGMQNVGFCYAMLPVVRRLGGGTEAVTGCLRRHLQTFNTNPALSCYALGAAASAELHGDGETAVEVKRALGGPLGMAGDSLMWWSLRPLAALLGVSFALSGHLWAPLVLMGVYNIPHLALRVRGIMVGTEQGASGAREVLGSGFRRLVTVVRAAGAFVAGLVVAMAVSEGGSLESRRVVTAAVFFALAAVALRLRIPITLIGVGAAAGGVALMLLGVA